MIESERSRIGATWHVAGASIQGASHEARDIECQDSHAWRELPDGTLIAAVSDGAGSRPRSAEGSHLIVREVLDRLETLAAAPPDDAAGWDTALRQVFFAAWSAVQDYADAQLVDISMFDATLSCAIATPAWCVVGQVGDGAVVLDLGPGGFAVPVLPENGEFANTTWFLTQLFAHREHVRVRFTPGPIHGIALSTDGLSDSTLEGPLRELSPRPAVWEAYFGSMRESIAYGDMSSRVREELESAKVRERLRDDLTLILAVPAMRPKAFSEPRTSSSRKPRAWHEGATLLRPLLGRRRAGKVTPKPIAPFSGNVESDSPVPAMTETEPIRELPASLSLKDLTLGQVVASGGQVTVYALPDLPGYLFKQIREAAAARIGETLIWMVAHPPPSQALDRLLWPLALVRDDADRPVGVVTRSLPDDVVPLRAVMTGDRQEIFRAFGREPFDLRERHVLAWNLAVTVDACHQHGLVLAHMSPDTVLVTSKGHVIVPEPEWFGVTTPEGGTYSSPLAPPTDYALPGRHPMSSAHAMPQDAFGLAIIVFQLLMESRHPFEGVGADGQVFDPRDHIANGIYPYTIWRDDAGSAPPASAPALARLHTELVIAFERAFVEGLASPHRLPDPAAWVDTLEAAFPFLQRCRRGHWYSTDRAICLEQGATDRYCGATATEINDTLSLDAVDPFTGHLRHRIAGATPHSLPTFPLGGENSGGATRRREGYGGRTVPLHQETGAGTSEEATGQGRDRRGPSRGDGTS